MDTKGIAAILLKITGLLLIVVSVTQLPGYFPLSGLDFSIGQVLGTAAAALGPLAIVGLVLWFFPGTVTNRIVSSGSANSVGVDARPIELVALTILGVYLVASGLVGAVRDVVFLVVTNRQAGVTPVPASIIAHAAATIAEILIGGGLCIGAKGISRFLERIRH